MEEKRQRMRELVERLREASKAYYQEDREIMSNFEYDKLYDELAGLEAETGIVLSGSPTQNVGYESQEELPKERHERPMLSLDKTKDVEVLKTYSPTRMENSARLLPEETARWARSSLPTLGYFPTFRLRSPIRVS